MVQREQELTGFTIIFLNKFTSKCCWFFLTKDVRDCALTNVWNDGWRNGPGRTAFSHNRYVGQCFPPPSPDAKVPFGVRNAPTTFQRLVNTVLSGLSGCEAYLDDIVVYSKTWEEHIQQLRAVFGRLILPSVRLGRLQ